MSYLPEISQDQRQRNKNKLINQNTKLHQQIFAFEQQMNQILMKQNKESLQMLQNQKRDKDNKINQSTSRIKRNSAKRSAGDMQNINNTSSPQKVQQILNDPTSLSTLIQSNSPLIQTRIIPTLKSQLEHLKCTNIKQNIHYLLQQQDQLKIIKKQLYKLRRQKQLLVENVKDKKQKLELRNKQLQSHKNGLRQQLNETLKYNRQSSANITEIERQIRKYHYALQKYKKLTLSSSQAGTKDSVNNEKQNMQIEKIKSNPSDYLNNLQLQMIRYKSQILQTQNIWKDKIQAINTQYCQLKTLSQQKQKQSHLIQMTQNFYKTRILVMKDQEHLQKQKDKLKLIKTNPFLQKQLEQYLKQQQQKIRKKEEYMKKHKRRDKQQEEFESKMIIKKSSQNPQKPILVQTSYDDKNIVQLKYYLNQKQKLDKQIQVKLRNKIQAQNHRLNRSWSRSQEEKNGLQVGFSQSPKKNTTKAKVTHGQKQRVKPRILLKSIKMGTSFNNESSQQDKAIPII